MSRNRKPTDTDVVDAIATMLGTNPSWTGDVLDDIANLVGKVRPHPTGGRPGGRLPGLRRPRRRRDLSVCAGVVTMTATTARLVVAVVPARNEPTIAHTVASLLNQTHPVDRVLVVVNNAAPGDTTAELARAAGAQVIVMADNPHLKAGAINRGLNRISMSTAGDDTAVLVMDADSALDPRWVELALPPLDEYGAVSGAYEASDAPGLLPLLQRAEFAQSRHRTAQMGGRVSVLSGAAAMFTLGLLRQVRAARGAALPGRPGDWYNTASPTEDFDMTLAAGQMGCRPMSPANLRVVTDVMRTVGDLWRQRVRWQQGCLQTLRQYPAAAAWRVWLAQVAVYLAALAPLPMALLVAGEVAAGAWTFDVRWLALPVLFAAADMWSVKRAGWRAVLLCAALLPMWSYRWWKVAIYLSAVPRALRSAGLSWHLERA